ncbi:MAG: glycosyltransferase [Staphylococcus sp.]|nr:glycosyltransferase [Staphylococcus sp.]
MRKKLLIIHESLRTGGAEKVLTDILRRFDYDRYDVTLFLWVKKGPYLSQIPPQVRLLTHPLGSSRLFERCQHRLPSRVNDWLRHKAVGRLQKEKFDVILSFMEGIPAVLHRILLPSAPKNVSWVHSDMDHYRWSEMYFPYKEAAKFYDMLDSIVFVSEGARLDFLNVFSPKADCVVVRNMQDASFIRQKGKELCEASERFTVCSVGRLIDEKRFDRVIDVAAYVRDKGYDIEFLIIGDGPMRGELTARIQGLGLEDCVKMLGFQENPYRYMAMSDLFMLTSQSEGYALVVGEALCLGKPVVSTIVTGPDELLRDGAGVLCEGSVEALAEAVIALHDNSDLRACYSAKAIEKSREFDPEATLEAIYSIL